MNTPFGMLSLEKNHRTLLGVLLCLFVVLVALGIHGFSLPLWRVIIDHSPTKELLLGDYRGVRSDDWMGNLPNFFAQINHVPKFPVVNENIGLGQNMLVYPHMPVANFFVLFRPSVWGFFLGADAGLAWQWWSRALGLFYCFFLLFQLVSGNQFRLSAFSALAFLFSPFVQFWALNAAEMLATMALSVVCAFEIASGYATGWRLFGWATGLWWAGTVFALGFYPAFQIPLTYAALGIFGYLSWRRFQEQGVPEDWKSRLAILSGVAVVILATATLFFLKTRGAIELMRHTVYPGMRHAHGGSQTLVFFFSNFIHFFYYPQVYSKIGNICEVASFFFFFPLCVVASWIGLAFGQSRQIKTLLPVYVCLAFLLVWTFVGLRDPFPAWTLMKHVPTNRALIAIGVLNAVLIVAYLSDQRLTIIPRWLSLALWAVWSLSLLYFAQALEEKAPSFPAGVLPGSVALMAGLGALILFRHWIAAPALALVSVALTIFFNPVVRGGSDFLVNNPLSREMRAIDKKEEGQSVWLVYGQLAMGNLPKILGLKSLSGQYFHPQLGLWSKLDPEGKFLKQYNRYAHSVWRVNEGPKVEISSPQADVVVVKIDPRSEILRKFGVNYFLVKEGNFFFQDNPQSFELVFSHADNRIYRYRVAAQ